MSGGYFNYVQYNVETDVLEPLKEWLVDYFNNKNSDTSGFSGETIEQIRNGYEKICEAYVYMQRLDYLFSGDESEENFHKKLSEDLEKLSHNKSFI